MYLKCKNKPFMNINGYLVRLFHLSQGGKKNGCAKCIFSIQHHYVLMGFCIKMYSSLYLGHHEHRWLLKARIRQARLSRVFATASQQFITETTCITLWPLAWIMWRYQKYGWHGNGFNWQEALVCGGGGTKGRGFTPDEVRIKTWGGKKTLEET